MDIFKMSKNENPNIVLKKVHFPDTLDHNALNFNLTIEKYVTIILLLKNANYFPRITYG